MWTLQSALAQITMAPAKIKRERDLSPPRSSGLGGSENEDESSMADTFTKIETANWKECGGDERFRRVKIKEFAAKNAQLALQSMSEILTRHAQLEQSCRPRIAKISKSASHCRNSSQLLLHHI